VNAKARESDNVESPEGAAPGASDWEAQAAADELAALCCEWWWLLVLGIALVILGMIAIGGAFFASVVTVIFFGALLLVGGIGQVVSAFWAGRWRGFLLHLLVGVFYIVVGLLILESPLASTVALTLLIAAFLIVSGIFRIVASMALRFPSWGWHLLSGVVTLMLGLLISKLITAESPAALLVIGLFVGIEMIFCGWSWVMLAVTLRSLRQREA
jgi:uncharacterized membrane protein HdeD (DUF308 family)